MMLPHSSFSSALLDHDVGMTGSCSLSSDPPQCRCPSLILLAEASVGAESRKAGLLRAGPEARSRRSFEAGSWTRPCQSIPVGTTNDHTIHAKTDPGQELAVRPWDAPLLHPYGP